MRNELPKTKDINVCCGRPTKVRRMRVPVRMMSNPPDTTDRWVVIDHWQCMTREDHSGEVWTTGN